MDYAQPMNYLIVINNNQLKIVSDESKSIMDLTQQDDDEPNADILFASHGGRPVNMSPRLSPGIF